MISVMLGLLLTLGLTPASAERLQQRPFNPSGYFIPQRSQENSSHVRLIHLSDHPRPGARGPVYVELRIGDGSRWSTFYQASLIITDDRIKFGTKARRGVSYEFEGQLFPSQRERGLGRFDDSPGAPTALRGVLHTKRGGKRVQSEDIEFFYTAG